MTASAKFIHRDVLIPHERAIRRPLQPWVSEIRQSLESGRRNLEGDLPKAATVVMACFNQAALVEVHFGRKQHAQDLCIHALAWLDGLITKSGNVECYKNGFQPFVNLARLDRINGCWIDALSKLDVLHQALRFDTVEMPGLTIPGNILHIILQDEQFSSILVNMSTIDRLKTLLKAGMFEQIPELAAERASSPSLRLFLAEAEAVALCCSGHMDRALKLNRQWLADFPGSMQPVFVFRVAETLAVSGQSAEALAALRKLKALFERSEAKLGGNNETLSNRLILLLKTSGLLLHLNAPEDCRDLAWLGHKYAVRLGDVLLTCEFLELIRCTGVNELEGMEIAQLLSDIKKRAWYGVARSGNDSPETDYATRTVDGLFDDLVSFTGQMATLPVQGLVV